MKTLGQVIAAVKTAKGQASTVIAQTAKILASPAPFNGMIRTYSPAVDGGAQLPAESVRLQLTGPQLLDRLFVAIAPAFDAVLEQETGDQGATAPIQVNGHTLLADAPVTYLLWLEKELTSLGSVLKGLPTLDAAHEWIPDVTATGVYRTAKVRTARKERGKVPLVLFPGNETHPPQVTLNEVENVAGYWEQILVSGALTTDEVAAIQQRIGWVILAVRQAREAANRTEVPDRRIADGLFRYLRTGEIAGNSTN